MTGRELIQYFMGAMSSHRPTKDILWGEVRHIKNNIWVGRLDRVMELIVFFVKYRPEDWSRENSIALSSIILSIYSISLRLHT